jgi:ATP/maltotriose-dependent transcriptional regulator MalT
LPLWALQDDLLGMARPWVEQLLPTAEALDPRARAELSVVAAVTAREVDDDAAALAARQRLGPVLAGIQDPYLHAVAQLASAWTSAIVGDFDGALREASVSLEELRSQEEPLWTAAALVTLGSVGTAVGRRDDALRHLTEMRDLAERFDNARLTAASRVQLGTLAVVRGRPEEARALLEEALDLRLGAFARLAFDDDDYEQVALLVGAAEGLRRRAGVNWRVAVRAVPCLHLPE